MHRDGLNSLCMVGILLGLINKIHRFWKDWIGSLHLIPGLYLTLTPKFSTLVMEPSDHVPCMIQISTSIPKGHIFHFENY